MYACVYVSKKRRLTLSHPTTYSSTIPDLLTYCYLLTLLAHSYCSSSARRFASPRPAAADEWLDITRRASDRALAPAEPADYSLLPLTYS